MDNQQMYQALGVSPAVFALGEEVLSSLTERFAELGVLVDGDAFVLHEHAGRRAAHLVRKTFHDRFLLL